MSALIPERCVGYESGTDIAPALGDLEVELPESAGRRSGLQCGSVTTFDAQHESGDFVVLFLGKPLDSALQGSGFYYAMTANAARDVAAGLLRAANNLDGRRTQ